MATNANETSAESKALQEVFDGWTAANIPTGLRASFVRSFDPMVWDIMIVKQNFNDVTKPAGVLEGYQLTPSGHWHKGTFAFNSQLNATNAYPLASNQDAYRRLGLHEVGHIHGLDHPDNPEDLPRKASVMLTDIQSNDRYYRRMADSPTACDASKARDASVGN